MNKLLFCKVPERDNREPGNPGRSHHCDRMLKMYICHWVYWEGVQKSP